MSALRWSLVLVTLLFPVAFVQAQVPDDEQLFSRLSDTTIEKILTEFRMPFERREETFNNKKVVTYHVTVANGMKATLLNSGNMVSLWSYGFKTLNKEDISLERINEWNKKNSFCKSHVEANGTGVLTSTLDMLDGTNKKIIRGWIREYAGTLPRFSEFTK